VADYEYKPDVDMSGYIPLAKRFKGACRCPVCSSNSEILKYFKNDFLCKSDGLPCDRFSDDTGAGVCSWNYGGSIHHCLRFVPVPLVRLAFPI
jgi:hypothetical protein